MKWLRKWVHNAVHNFDTVEHQITGGSYPKPRNPLEEVVSNLSSTVGQIFRIDNGFLVAVNMGGNHEERSSFVYAKDAQEVAEKIVAHEAAVKMGVNRPAHPQATQTPGISTAKNIYKENLNVI